MACWDLGPQTVYSSTLACDVVKTVPVIEKVHSPSILLCHRVMFPYSIFNVCDIMLRVGKGQIAN